MNDDKKLMTFNVPEFLKKEMKIHCIKKEITITSFLIELIKKALRINGEAGER